MKRQWNDRKKQIGLRKVSAAIMSAVLMLTASPVYAPAAEAPDATVEMAQIDSSLEQTVLPADQDTPDTNELFYQYMLQEGKKALAEDSAGTSGAFTPKGKAITSTAGYRLNAQNQYIYGMLAKEIKKVASGELLSTVINIDVTRMPGYKETWTAADLGLDTLGTVGSAELNQAMNALKARLSVDVSAVIHALLVDYPYEMYWFDKTVGYSCTSIEGEYSYNSRTNEIESLKAASSITWTLRVEREFAPGNVARGTTLDKDKISYYKISTAINEAANIVSNNASKTNYDKLKAYKDRICELTTYNSAAIEEGYIEANGYGNPWQLIYVFDKVDSTKVVCEGYSKAFQYLCDLSTFSDTVNCHTVYGDMIGGKGAGGHMWNVVNIGGKNYLVDVTNCNSGTIGYPDKLFMVGTTGTEYTYTFSDGSTKVPGYPNDYTFQMTYSTIRYVYDHEMSDIWDKDSVLTLSSTNYDPVNGSSQTPVTPTWQARVINIRDFDDYGYVLADSEGTEITRDGNVILPVSGGFRFSVTVNDGYQVEDGSGEAEPLIDARLFAYTGNEGAVSNPFVYDKGEVEYLGREGNTYQYYLKQPAVYPGLVQIFVSGIYAVNQNSYDLTFVAEEGSLPLQQSVEYAIVDGYFGDGGYKNATFHTVQEGTSTVTIEDGAVQYIVLRSKEGYYIKDYYSEVGATSDISYGQEEDPYIYLVYESITGSNHPVEIITHIKTAPSVRTYFNKVDNIGLKLARCVLSEIRNGYFYHASVNARIPLSNPGSFPVEKGQPAHFISSEALAGYVPSSMQFTYTDINGTTKTETVKARRNMSHIWDDTYLEWRYDEFQDKYHFEMQFSSALTNADIINITINFREANERDKTEDGSEEEIQLSNWDYFQFSNSSTFLFNTGEQRNYDAGTYVNSMYAFLDQKYAGGYSNYFKNILKNAMRTEWFGSCFGFSAIEGVYNTKTLNVAGYDPTATKLSEMRYPTDYRSNRHLLNYYQISQYVDYFREPYYVLNTSDGKSELLRMANYVVTQKKPVMLCYYYGASCGHAVIVDSGTRKTDGSYVLNVRDNRYFGFNYTSGEKANEPFMPELQISADGSSASMVISISDPIRNARNYYYSARTQTENIRSFEWYPTFDKFAEVIPGAPINTARESFDEDLLTYLPAAGTEASDVEIQGKNGETVLSYDDLEQGPNDNLKSARPIFNGVVDASGKTTETPVGLIGYLKSGKTNESYTVTSTSASSITNEINGIVSHVDSDSYVIAEVAKASAVTIGENDESVEITGNEGEFTIQLGGNDGNGNTEPIVITGESSGGEAVKATLTSGGEVNVEAPSSVIYSVDTSGGEYTVTIDNKTGSKTPAEISGIASGSKYSNDVAFTVTCTNACVVAYSTDGGNTYTRLTPTAANGNERAFTMKVQADTKLFVGLKGDAMLDGSTSLKDATYIKQYLVGMQTMTPEKQLVADTIGNNDGVSLKDATFIKQYLVGMQRITW